MGEAALDQRLGTAVRAMLGAIGQRGREAACLPFEEEERRTWAYWPTERRGVPLHELDRAGTKAVHRVLGALLPAPAFARAAAIMSLDEVLDLSEGQPGIRRHRDDYWVSVFGDPDEPVWGWRFEGHHVSLHATVVAGDVHLTPLFLGANPAVVLDRGRVVSAPLAAEEALGFELLHALGVEQRASAVVADVAPDDNVTRSSAEVDLSLLGGGVPLAALSGAARAIAGEVLDLYLGRFPAGAHVPDPADARFAWAGADAPGVGHHYRIVGPRLVIELDNTQDGANHVHTVVRDPTADFGGDPLAAHRRRAHAPVDDARGARPVG